MNQDLRRRLIRPTILDPLLHRTVRLVVLHTGRGDCSPHKITHKMQKLKRRPLQTGLAPRRTHKISVPAMVQSKQRRPDPEGCKDGAFPARPPPSYPVASHRGGITGTARSARAHRHVRGDPLHRGGPLKGGRRLFKAPPRHLHVADNGGLLTPAHRSQPLHAAGMRPEAPCAANGHTKGITVLGETRQPSAGGRTSSQAVPAGQ